MNKKVYFTAALVLVLSASTAWSQNAPNNMPPPMNGAPPSNNSGSFQPNGNSQGQPGGERFEEVKARILNHINQHLAEVEQRHSCVEAATTREALMGCMPMHREGGNEQGGGQFHSMQGQGPHFAGGLPPQGQN